MSAGGEASSPRRAIVTGAASGLGRACLIALRARGCAVAALDLQPAEIEAEHVGVCDFADIEATAAAVSEAVSALGGLDAAAHCAGVHPDKAMPLHELDPQTWERTLAVNLTGSYAFARAVLPELATRRPRAALRRSPARSRSNTPSMGCA
jgi:NAD(P)-dependent dehydrogenase (short-subunit alcohol dehydrogenase family)